MNPKKDYGDFIIKAVITVFVIAVCLLSFIHRLQFDFSVMGGHHIINFPLYRIYFDATAERMLELYYEQAEENPSVDEIDVFLYRNEWHITCNPFDNDEYSVTVPATDEERETYRKMKNVKWTGDTQSSFSYVTVYEGKVTFSSEYNPPILIYTEYGGKPDTNGIADNLGGNWYQVGPRGTR